jgi:ornithine decarboxylase
MPTLVADRFTSLEYTDYTNNHVFLKTCSTPYFSGHLHNHHHAHHDHHDYHNHHEGRRIEAAKQLIGQALRERVESVDHDFCEPGEEDTFFVADLGEVYRQHLRWKLNLPRVKPFYGE